MYDNSCIEQVAIKGMYVYNAMLPQTDVHVHDGAYGVMLRIVKAGCHPVAIAQVVEH